VAVVGGVQNESAVREEVARITGNSTAWLRGPISGWKCSPWPPSLPARRRRAFPGRTTMYPGLRLHWQWRSSARLSGGKSHPLIFVRHKSGPVYYWYEALSTRYLQRDRRESEPADDAPPICAHVDDVVVDDLQELLWRLRPCSL